MFDRDSSVRMINPNLLLLLMLTFSRTEDYSLVIYQQLIYIFFNTFEGEKKILVHRTIQRFYVYFRHKE